MDLCDHNQSIVKPWIFILNFNQQDMKGMNNYSQIYWADVIGVAAGIPGFQRW